MRINRGNSNKPSINRPGAGSKIPVNKMPTLSAPASVIVSTISATQLNISWGASTGATTYLLERSLNGSTGWSQIYSGSSLSYSDTGRANATTYYYRVKATATGYNSSAYSSTQNGTTGAGSATLVPIKTGKDIAVSGYPLYVRDTGNDSEIGTATDLDSLVTILNGNAGWATYGTWSNNAGSLQCDGSAPAKVIGYTKVGTIFSTNDVADFTWSDADITFVNESGKMRFTTTDENSSHKITLATYGKTMLGDIEFKFDIDVLSTTPSFDFGVMVDAPRVLNCSYSSSMSVQDDGTNVLGVSNATTGRGSGTYNVTLRIHGNVTTFIVQKGANTSTATLTAPMTTEHNVGKFAIRFTQIDCRIYNVKVDCIAYKNCDNVCIGDSVTRGRGANSFATNHYNQVIGTKPTTWMALGNVGFLEWIECIGEIQAVDPAQVWIMGSYVDTPAGLSTFQSRYNTLITDVKLCPSLQTIFHLASFPNNFGTDIRPFNNWKESTYNTGIDRYINDFYALLLEGSSGYDLKDSYDYGGSHLTQAAQDIVAASILAEV